MRLDKFLTEMRLATRSEAGKAARSGRVFVNGLPAKDVSCHIDPEKDEIVFDGEKIAYRRYLYLALNKPEGYVSATEDANAPTVLELVPPSLRRGMSPVGRLDKYTTGLMLLTDDGETAHYLLSPRHHVDKSYRYTLRDPLAECDRVTLEGGVPIEGGYLTAPCRVQTESETVGVITIHEGKYHQVKQMFESVGNKVIALERIAFGPLTLSEMGISRGEYRELNETEIRNLLAAAGRGREKG